MELMNKANFIDKVEKINENLTKHGLPHTLNMVASLTRYIIRLETYIKLTSEENITLKAQNKQLIDRICNKDSLLS